MSFFTNMSISAKIYGAVAFCLAALIGSSLFAILQISQIGKELEAIAEEDIPLTVAITEAAASQLEQTIQFERMLKSALEENLGLPGAEKYPKVKEKFHFYGVQVDEYIVKAEEIAAHGVEHALNDDMEAKFTEVLEKLKVLEAEHKVFETHVVEVEALLESGDIVAGVELGELVDEEADKLDHEIEDLLRDVSNFTAQSALTAEHHEQSALKWLAIACVVIVLTVTPAVIFIVQVSVPKPLREVLGHIDNLASGELDEEILVFRSDEIGRIMEGLEGFRLKLIDNKKLEAEMNNSQRSVIERGEKVEAINQEFDETVGDILGTVTTAAQQMNDTASSMSSASEDARSKSHEVLETAQESSQNMASVSSATEELSASIREIAGQTSHATEVARTAVDSAESVRSQTTDMVENAQKIDEVVNLISGIAEQTNLLALNATIEAARAGEAGKGFAVVASEVKGLAGQTAKATEDISSQIASMQQATTNTAEAIDNIVSTIQGVNDVITAISGAVAEQEGAIGEITQNIQMVTNGSQYISDNMRDVSDSVGNTGESAGKVLGASEMLNQEADKLRNQIQDFLSKVKAA
ncbi:MAG: methyl-accepting chemotaxis protein [Hyphomicrobiales bacterium]